MVAGYTGFLTLMQSLGQNALQSLSNDGIVDFTLRTSTGDIIYTGGTLTADIVANPVPIPSAVLLSSLGLGVAGYRLRRKAQ